MNPQWQFHLWEDDTPEEGGYRALHSGPFQLCVYEGTWREGWRCDLRLDAGEIAFRTYPTEAAALADAVPLLVETLSNWMIDAFSLACDPARLVEGTGRLIEDAGRLIAAGNVK